MARRLTRTMLKEMGACEDGLDDFLSQFPDGVAVIEATEEVYSQVSWLPWQWAAQKLLSEEDYREYVHNYKLGTTTIGQKEDQFRVTPVNGELPSWEKVDDYVDELYAELNKKSAMCVLDLYDKNGTGPKVESTVDGE